MTFTEWFKPKEANSSRVEETQGQTTPSDTEEGYDPSSKKNVGVVTIDTMGTDTSTGTVWEDGEAPHKFDDPAVASYYKEQYELAKYEGRAYFDPKFRWTRKEEKRLVRKTELLATGWAFLMFVALDIDRSNIGNAVSDNMLKDLKLTTNDYNLGSTLNLVAFLAAEIPSQLVSKKLGPDVWIPIQMCLWSLVAIFQCFMQNRAGFLVCRILLGALEGGFIPDVILWLSYFYTGAELSVRIGYFYVANPLTGAFSALLAYGIFHLDGYNGWQGWRYLFLIEGAITLLFGIMAFFMMPPSAVQTRTRYRPKGWYTDREEKIMVNRVLRDDPSKGLMHNREALTFRHIWNSLKDYNLWPIVLTRIFADLPQTPIGQYLTIILREMGFSTLHTNLLLIPKCIGSIITNVAFCHLSTRLGEHGWIITFSTFWVAVCIGVMKFWPEFLVNHWGSYALLTVMLSYPFAASLTVSWSSTNSNSVATRTVSASTVNVGAQFAGIVGSNIFRKDDAPRYHRGITQCFALSVVAIAVSVLTRYYYYFTNKRRDAIWGQMTPEERLDYIQNTTDQGSKRIDFRFAT